MRCMFSELSVGDTFIELVAYSEYEKIEEIIIPAGEYTRKVNARLNGINTQYFYFDDDDVVDA